MLSRLKMWTTTKNIEVRTIDRQLLEVRGQSNNREREKEYKHIKWSCSEYPSYSHFWSYPDRHGWLAAVYPRSVEAYSSRSGRRPWWNHDRSSSSDRCGPWKRARPMYHRKCDHNTPNNKKWWPCGSKWSRQRNRGVMDFPSLTCSFEPNARMYVPDDQHWSYFSGCSNTIIRPSLHSLTFVLQLMHSRFLNKKKPNIDVVPLW